MASQALPQLLKGCRAMEAILEQQRAAKGGPLGAELLRSKAEAAESLAAGLEAFKKEQQPLSRAEASSLLKALLTLRAHAASSADFEALRVRLAETLDRLARPALASKPAAYDQGGRKMAPPASPTRLDKTY
jgi:hypothetical protein